MRSHVMLTRQQQQQRNTVGQVLAMLEVCRWQKARWRLVRTEPGAKRGTEIGDGSPSGMASASGS